MTEVTRESIHRWVEASDAQEALARLSLSEAAQEAAQQAESVHRAGVVVAAVVGELQHRLDVLDTERQAIETQQDEIRSMLAGALPEHSSAKRQAQDEPLERPFAPFGLGVPPDVSFVHAYDRTTKRAEYKAFKAFKDSIRPYLEPIGYHSVTNVGAFLLGAYDTEQVPGIDEVVTFHENGVVFESSEPDEYRDTLQQVAGFGRDSIEALLRMAQRLSDPLIPEETP